MSIRPLIGNLPVQLPTWRRLMRITAAQSLGAIRAGVHAMADVLPPSWLLRGLGGMPLVLYYHAVSDSPLPHIENLYRFKSIQEFEADLDYLLCEFCPIELEQLKSFIQNGKQLPAQAFYLTFDDGLREMTEIVAPLLKRKGLSAAFFINSGFMENQDLAYRFKASLLISKAVQRGITVAEMNYLAELFCTAGLPWTDNFAANLKSVDYRHSVLLDQVADILDVDFHEFLRTQRPYMNTKEVKALACDGFVIGSHSVDHPRYTELDLAEQLNQTRNGARHLAERIGVNHKVFAFPFTEQQVSHVFFQQLLQEETIELFFGTSGWNHQTDKRLVQRVSLEGDKPSTPIFLRRSMADAMIHRFSFT